MIDMTTTIAPKSDQLNSDDLIGRSKTIRVTEVKLLGGDQPVALHYDGDQGKPYKPGKSMRRVLVHVWGQDGNGYVGKSMTLYRDVEVTFGGSKVGGIRISHMSDIDAPITLALTVTRANRKPYTVQPLRVEPPKAAPVVAEGPGVDDEEILLIRNEITNTDSKAEIEAVGGKIKSALPRLNKEQQTLLQGLYRSQLAIIKEREAKQAEADPFSLAAE